MLIYASTGGGNSTSNLVIVVVLIVVLVAYIPGVFIRNWSHMRHFRFSSAQRHGSRRSHSLRAAAATC